MAARSTLMVAVLSTMLLASCAARSVRIADLKDRPGRYEDKTVSIRGTVTSSVRLPFAPAGWYKVDDGSGEISVVSTRGRAPSTGAHVQVKGRVNELASFGSQSIGLHIEERDRKIR